MVKKSDNTGRFIVAAVGVGVILLLSQKKKETFISGPEDTTFVPIQPPSTGEPISEPIQIIPEQPVFISEPSPIPTEPIVEPIPTVSFTARVMYAQGSTDAKHANTVASALRDIGGEIIVIALSPFESPFIPEDFGVIIGGQLAWKQDVLGDLNLWNQFGFPDLSPDLVQVVTQRSTIIGQVVWGIAGWTEEDTSKAVRAFADLARAGRI